MDPLKLMFTLIAIVAGVAASGWQEPVTFSTATAINCGTASYASKILENHNVHRRNHSAGDLVWDNTLAGYAEILARRCGFQHDMYVFHTSSHERKRVDSPNLCETKEQLAAVATDRTCIMLLQPQRAQRPAGGTTTRWLTSMVAMARRARHPVRQVEFRTRTMENGVILRRSCGETPRGLAAS
jgi:hypothetical protein